MVERNEQTSPPFADLADGVAEMQFMILNAPDGFKRYHTEANYYARIDDFDLAAKEIGAVMEFGFRGPPIEAGVSPWVAKHSVGNINIGAAETNR